MCTITGSTLSVTTYITVIYCETIMSSACDADSLRSEHITEALPYSLLNFVQFVHTVHNKLSQSETVHGKSTSSYWCSLREFAWRHLRLFLD